MKAFIACIAMLSLIHQLMCLPYQQGAKNSMSHVALQILDMLKGECQTYNYTETIKRPGCKPVRVVNKFCGGKCISKYYPGFAYCTACMPKKITTKKVFFKCPSDPVKKVRHRKIQVVQGCQCKRFVCKK